MAIAPKEKSQSEFKLFEQLFNKISRIKSERRQSARGTLTPDLLRRHLASGAPLPLLYGAKKDGTPFTAEDLKRFDQQAQAVRKTFGAGQSGVRIDQLIKASRSIDIERSREQIKTATLYRIFNSAAGVVLHFRTDAGPNSQYKAHRVKVRLEEWTDWLTSTANFKDAASQILNGRVSYDCDCGRHQYWYRYLATVGGFALKPLEFSYPKIRNPGLTGACCKHVLKVLASMKGPAVRNLIVTEMKKDAEKIGFGGEKTAANRFLKKDELEKVRRSSAATKTLKAFQDYLKAKKGIKKKMSEPKTIKALEKAAKTAETKAATLEKIARKEQARREQAEKDLVLSKLSGHLALAIYRDKMTKAQAVEAFAKANDMPAEQVAQLAEGINI